MVHPDIGAFPWTRKRASLPDTLQDRSSSRSRLLILAGIVLLYPGFFIYHSAVALLKIPPVLGGYYGNVCLALFPLLLIFYARAIRTHRIVLTRADAVFGLLCLYVGCWSLIYWAVGEKYQQDPFLLNQSVSILVLWGVNYMLFRDFTAIGRGGRWVLIFSLALMLAIAFVNQQNGFFYAKEIAGRYNEEEIASYQGFARSALVTSMMLLANGSRRSVLWIFGISLILLFVLGARSEFLGFLAVGLLVMNIRFGSARFNWLIMSVLLVALAITADWVVTAFDNTRIVHLLDYQDDTSFQSRELLNDAAWKSIANSPLLGDYGSYLVTNGVGKYAHNALSAWVDYGLIGFFGFIYLIFRSLIKAWGALPLNKHLASEQTILCLSLALYCVIIAITAKSVQDPIYATAWGIAGGVLVRRTSTIY